MDTKRRKSARKTHKHRENSFFRSEIMYFCRLYLLSESAYSCLAELGELGLVQFIESDINYKTSDHQYNGEIRRCDEMLLLLQDLKANIIQSGILLPDIIAHAPAPTNKEITEIDNDLHNLTEELTDVTKNYDILKKNHLELLELKQVILCCDSVFDDNIYNNLSDTFKGLNNETNLIEQQQFENNKKQYKSTENQLSYFTGVIPSKKCNNFEKMLWRICYGNYYLKLIEISGEYEDSYTKEKNIKKNVFIIFFHGDAIKIKIKKILDAFHATQYVCPETSDNRRDMIDDINMKLNDLIKILSESEDHRLRILKAAAGTYDIWSIKINKYKGIYHILNIMDMDETKKMYICEVWLPRSDLIAVNKAIQKGTQKINLPTPPLIEKLKFDTVPPTYIRTNSFTVGFQALINAYGIALYRELNPAPYTIITFPFLFAVMFGDVGHGILIFIFAYWMIHYEKYFLSKKSTNEIWNMFFGGRYIILLMGLFSIYTGLIYNDIFSASINIFGSKWRINYNLSTIMSNDKLQLDPATNAYLKTPYDFGLDPVWHLSENKIIVTNSYKMKISIIFGVLQMVFGLVLSAINHQYYHNKISMILEFLPQLIFLNFLFSYLVVLIFVKWIKYSCDNEIAKNERCAPSILQVFIDMMLFKPTPPTAENCNNFMFEYEDKIQIFLVLVAFICVPILFFGKPIFLFLRKNKDAKERKRKSPDLNRSGSLYHRSQGAGSYIPADLFEENENMDEIVIHQGIHTIESVLGSVSHTASYLRLWALSLAHSQLSSVLWNMIFSKALKFNDPFGFIVIVPAFAIWAVLTVAILVVMEGLSAFLHALRLHWVEFQSKFYLGSGYLFQPFCFKIK